MIRLRQLRCSFCRKKDSEVSKLVVGPRVYICDACVAIATQLMDDPSNSPPSVQSSAWREALTRVRQFIRGGHALRIDLPIASR
jgi:ATP-dependent protease Clp ATPase subunit